MLEGTGRIGGLQLRLTQLEERTLGAAPRVLAQGEAIPRVDLVPHRVGEVGAQSMEVPALCPEYLPCPTGIFLRAVEIGASVLLKATKVDGVYTADPVKDSSAQRYDQLTYGEVLAKRLAVLDSTATSLCMDNEMPILVFDINQQGNISRAALGESVGTLIHGGTNP